MKASHRRLTKHGRISLEEQEVLLEQFWDTIDAEIAAGELPPPKE